MYSYVDPCTKDFKYISGDMSAPIMIAYYGEVKSFRYEELYNGTFDAWINAIYNKYRTTSPCQGAVATTTVTTTTALATTVVNSVMNLNSIASVASMGSSLNVGAATDRGTNNQSTNEEPNSDNTTQSNSSTGSGDAATNPKSPGSGDNTSQGNSTGSSGNSNGSSSGNSGSGGSNGEGQSTGSSGGNTSENKGRSGSQSGVGSNGSGSGSGSGGGNSGNGGNDPGASQKKEESGETPSEQQAQEESGETGGGANKSSSKSKTKVQKPAILVTGDIVGIQTASDGSQDARGTMSFTKVKGDGSASIGISADYMVNAKIGNINLMKSWIAANEKGHKHINVLSNSISILPRSLSNTLLFVRVNSLKRFTALYGGAGTYGKLFDEEFISTLAIAGFMYKGKLFKNVDATIIAAGVWAPYTKYYTESFLESQPIIVPFLNLNYRLTKTFGVGITGGGTYISGQDVVNYQVLCGAKLLL